MTALSRQDSRFANVPQLIGRSGVGVAASWAASSGSSPACLEGGVKRRGGFEEVCCSTRRCHGCAHRADAFGWPDKSDENRSIAKSPLRARSACVVHPEPCAEPGDLRASVRERSAHERAPRRVTEIVLLALPETKSPRPSASISTCGNSNLDGLKPSRSCLTEKTPPLN